MADSKISVGLRQVVKDMLATARASKTASPVAVQAFKDMTLFADRIAGYAGELEYDADQPNAGTSAYEMVAAAEMAHVNTTHTLLGMVAATVLAKLIDEGDCNRANVSFTPRTMDDMYTRYDLAIEQEGLETKVRITPKPGAFAQGGEIELTGVTEAAPLPPAEAALAGRPESLMRQDEPDSPADEQAIPTEAEKHYFFNDGTKRYGPMPLATAEQHARMTPNLLAHIENRACPLVDCPSAGHATSCAWETCPNRK